MKFQLEQEVRIKLSSETGHVTGRCEYTNGTPNVYQVKYLSKAGSAQEEWFTEGDIETVA